ncbi:MAG: 2-oxoacid:acceptor oxidoreductase family protein [Nitrososphaerales archaeon]
MRWEFRITGIGGQGAISIAHIIGRAAVMYDSREAVVTEGYSPYITGGWSRGDVIVSDEQVDFPLVTRLDVLLTMYQEGLDLNLKLMKPDGVILTEKRLVHPKSAGPTRRVVEIPAMEAAEKIGKKILTNVVMLGGLSAVSPAVSPEALKKALADRFPKAKDLNAKALDIGFELAKHSEEAPHVV